MTTELNDIVYTELTADDPKPQDIEDINRLIPQLSTSANPLTMSWLREVLTSGTRIFIARDGNNGPIIGTVLLCTMKILVGPKDWIEDVVTDKAYRGLGIMGALMDMAESASSNGSAKCVNLTSNSSRGPARAAYTQRGYELRETGVFRLNHRH